MPECPTGEYFIEYQYGEEQGVLTAPFGSPWLFNLDGDKTVAGCSAAGNATPCLSVTSSEVRFDLGDGIIVFDLRELRVWLDGHSSVYVGEFVAEPRDATGEPIHGRFRVCYAGTGFT